MLKFLSVVMAGTIARFVIRIRGEEAEHGINALLVNAQENRHIRIAHAIEASRHGSTYGRWMKEYRE